MPKNYYGHKIAHGFRSCTVYIFRSRDKKLLGTLKRTPNRDQSKAQRAAQFSEFLAPFGIKVAQFD